MHVVCLPAGCREAAAEPKTADRSILKSAAKDGQPSGLGGGLEEGGLQTRTGARRDA